MANPTTYFGWVMPTATDLVTDLPADFNVFGQGVDTSMQFLLGGTTGQVLSKTSATDMAFTWIANDTGDITGVTAGTGISGGGTSGTVTVTNSMATAITTNGDIIYGTGSGTFSRLGIGSNAQVLTVASGIPSWATPSAALTKVTSATFTNVATTTTSFDGVFTSTYDNYMVVFNNMSALTNTSNLQFQLRNSAVTQATAYYGNSTVGSTVTTTSNAAAFNIGVGYSDATQQNSYTFIVYRNTNRLSWSFQGMTRNGNGGVVGGGFSDSIAANGADGFILSASSGNITGKATIYGLSI